MRDPRILKSVENVCWKCGFLRSRKTGNVLVKKWGLLKKKIAVFDGIFFLIQKNFSLYETWDLKKKIRLLYCFDSVLYKYQIWGDRFSNDVVAKGNRVSLTGMMENVDVKTWVIIMARVYERVTYMQIKIVKFDWTYPVPLCVIRNISV